VGTLIIGSLVLACFAAWGAKLASPTAWLALLLGLAAGGTPYLYLYWKRQGRFKKFDAQLPEAIDLMARALRAGHAIVSAVEIVSEETSQPLAAEFRTVFDEQNLGLAIREALLNLVSRVPTDGVRFLATAILLQKETGGNLAEIMDKAGSVMRERIRLKGQLRVYTAQGRMTGWFLCCLPFFVFGLISVVNRDYERLLWTSPIGVRLIYGALALMFLGVYAIRKIISIKV
jgi:tight adherence protein B